MAFLMQVSFKFQSSLSPPPGIQLWQHRMTLRGEKKVSLGITLVDSPVEYGVWLRIVAQVGSCVLVHCGEFFLHQTAILLYVCGKMHHRVFLGCVNKNAGCILALWIVCTVYSTVLIEKSDKITRVFYHIWLSLLGCGGGGVFQCDECCLFTDETYFKSTVDRSYKNI